MVTVPTCLKRFYAYEHSKQGYVFAEMLEMVKKKITQTQNTAQSQCVRKTRVKRVYSVGNEKYTYSESERDLPESGRILSESAIGGFRPFGFRNSLR